MTAASCGLVKSGTAHAETRLSDGRHFGRLAGTDDQQPLHILSGRRRLALWEAKIPYGLPIAGPRGWRTDPERIIK